MTVVLYHMSGSLCSQKVRLALAEKGVSYEKRTVDIGRKSENYEPWYARLNPKLVIPTLVHDGKPVTDSARIVRYIDETFEGPALHAESPEGRAEEDHWLATADRFPLRELSYGSLHGPMGWFMRRTDAWKLKKLARLRDAHPDLAPLYEAKMEDIRAWFKTSRDPVQIGAILQRLDALLDAFEAHVGGRAFVNGARYGVADILWTVVLARLYTLGYRARVEARPNTFRWYRSMRARASFEAATIWEGVPWKSVLFSLLGRKM